jgi:PAS domain S-box-containing protein
MRAFEARAIENIATAPASRADRRAATIAALAIAVLFVASAPFSQRRIAEIPAFVPTVVGAAILALILTTVLLFVQYRIVRDLKLALLALAYGVTTATQTLYLLAFPHLFASDKLIAGAQTAPWSYIVSQLGFGAFIFAEGLAARYGWRLQRTAVRAVVLVTALLVLVFALLVTLEYGKLPEATNGVLFTPLWTRLVVPAVVVLLVVALVVAAGRLQTVTEVWLGVVLLARIVSLITGNEISSARFSVGWYAGRLEELIAAVVVLAVFLVKINDLMLRLAARSRSTAEALAFGEARYDALANVVPQLIWMSDARGELEFVNDRWTAYTGNDLETTRQASWLDAVDPEHVAIAAERWRASLQHGEPFAAECRIREGATGWYRWFLVNAVPVRDARGVILTWIGTCTDVDAQKRLEEREAFLAKAGDRLTASLDTSATVDAIEALLIPRLAERTWIALLDRDGRYVVAGIGSSDPDDDIAAQRWLGTRLQPDLHDFIVRIVKHDEPIVLGGAERFTDPWLRELAAGATMIVPLVSGETPIGALALVRPSGRLYDLDDVGLVRELAHRAALSLEHARLYERERMTADALQRAMLPAQLPMLPHIVCSASYWSASESQRVGGDFYDAFELPDGRLALAIGDVTGHGLEAAVIMGEIRQAIRAAAFECDEPSTVLDRASRLLVASGRSLFVTAIFGILDPLSGRFTYATAGHPPPILHGEQTLQRLPTSGLPIGLRDDDGVDFVLHLQAPCTLVFYTDGLLEYGRDILEGERRIEAAVRELAGEQKGHLATALLKAVLPLGQPSDDVAILTVRVDRVGAPIRGDEREWRFSSGDSWTSALVRHEIGTLVHAWTGREETQFAAELAFGELVANAVRHAPGRLRVIVREDECGNVAVVVEDSGAGFTPGAPHLDPFAESGRGLGIVAAVSDGLEIEPSGRGGTRATVSFEAVHALAASL